MYQYQALTVTVIMNSFFFVTITTEKIFITITVTENIFTSLSLLILNIVNILKVITALQKEFLKNATKKAAKKTPQNRALKFEKHTKSMKKTF